MKRTTMMQVGDSYITLDLWLQVMKDLFKVMVSLTDWKIINSPQVQPFLEGGNKKSFGIRAVLNGKRRDGSDAEAKTSVFFPQEGGYTYKEPLGDHLIGARESKRDLWTIAPTISPAQAVGLVEPICWMKMRNGLFIRWEYGLQLYINMEQALYVAEDDHNWRVFYTGEVQDNANTKGKPLGGSLSIHYQLKGKTQACCLYQMASQPVSVPYNHWWREEPQ